VLAADDDIFNNFYLKPGKKENQDYKVVDQEAWKMLSARYAGIALRRYSIAVPTENPTRPDYLVEVQLRKFKIYTLPKVQYFKNNVNAEVYVSRADTVKELISRICSS